MGTKARANAPATQTGNMIRDSALGLVPETLPEIIALNGAVWHSSLVAPALLEMIRLRNARTVNCVYCKAVRYEVARSDGLTEERAAMIDANKVARPTMSSVGGSRSPMTSATGRVEMNLEEAAWFAANFGVPVEDVLRHADVKAPGSKKRSSKLSGKKAKAVEPKPMIDPDAHAGSTECRHPLYGALKGYITFLPGVDLTEPADPEWGERAWGDDPK
jgi:hypothetical protein